MQLLVPGVYGPAVMASQVVLMAAVAISAGDAYAADEGLLDQDYSAAPLRLSIVVQSPSSAHVVPLP